MRVFNKIESDILFYVDKGASFEHLLWCMPKMNRNDLHQIIIRLAEEGYLTINCQNRKVEFINVLWNARRITYDKDRKRYVGDLVVPVFSVADDFSDITGEDYEIE